ncbi:MAG: tyrosine-type recombinase/integrase [Dysosmobacter welbionis]|jgi:integrase
METIRAYLADLSGRGRRKGTVQMYSAKLRALYDYLPPDKQISRGTLAAWRAFLLEAGYSPSTVNTHLSAANGLMEYMGRRDLQLVGQLEADKGLQPELSRVEYLRLLQAARILEKERTYLLVKIFALAGIRVGELPQVTVERVRAGRLPVRTGGERRYVPLPACLQGELLDYARRQGLTAGPVFCTRNGKGMSRTQVTEEIQTLCHDARVEEEKGTPRCLRKLYLATRAEVERGVRLLAEQSYERMLDTEQLAAGWAEGTGHSIHKDVYI